MFHLYEVNVVFFKFKYIGVKTLLQIKKKVFIQIVVFLHFH